MLKTVSSITNAIGALNYKGTWNANTNSPALASGVGTKGDYYVVGTAGATTLDGISNWGVGDWAVFNGSIWQRVEGGADLNGVNLSVSGTSTLSALTASTALALNGSKEVVSVTNTGSGDNVLGTSPTIATPTLTGNVSMTTGNLVVGTAGKGIDFSADPHAAGMTSELLDDYEEGTFTPTINQGFTAPVSYTSQVGRYTKVGDLVYFHIYIYMDAGQTRDAVALGIAGLPFASASGIINGCAWGYASGVVGAGVPLPVFYFGGSTGIFYNTAGAAFLGTSLSSARPEIAISGVYKAA